MLRTTTLLAPLLIGVGGFWPAMAQLRQQPPGAIAPEPVPVVRTNLAVLAQAPALDPGDGPGQAPQARVSFPSARVTLVPPAGFEVAELFEGFQRPESQASLMVLSLPAPYATVMSGFDGERLASAGLTLRSQESLELDGRPGRLLDLSQRVNGMDLSKWILLLDQDGNSTVIINATVPQSEPPAVSERLKQAVLSTRVDDSLAAPLPEDTVDFSLTPSSDLKLATSLGGTLLYNQAGVLTPEAPGNPLFIAAPSFSRVVVASPAEFARRRLYQTEQITIDQIMAERTVTIDGLPGYEIIAAGQDQPSGTALRIYQVVLFDDGQYILLTGLVDDARSDRFLNQFQRMAESFRRKP